MKYWIFCAFLFSAFQLPCQTPLSEVTSFIQKGQNDKALHILNNFYNSGYNSGSMFYLMALAYKNKEEVGKAIYFAEKSLLWSPNDPLTIDLLSTLRGDQPDIDEAFSHFLPGHKIINALMPVSWFLISIFSLGILLILTHFFIFRNKKIKAFFYIAVVLGLVIILSFWAGNTRYQALFNNKFGIVIVDQSALLLHPDSSSPKIRTLTHGSKLKIKSKYDEWVEVETVYGEKGWIDQEKINPL